MEPASSNKGVFSEDMVFLVCVLVLNKKSKKGEAAYVRSA